MNVLRNIQLARSCTPWLTRINRQKSGESSTTDVRNMVLEPLDQRQLVRVSGAEVVSFLQGLTTNDMKMLELPTVPATYTMFLNKAGRVMYDAIVYRTPDPQTVLIECDKDISKELRRHLTIYRVRRKIQIDDIAQEMKLWVLFDKDGLVNKPPQSENQHNVQVITDPRMQRLGFRLLTHSDMTHTNLSQLCSNMDNVVIEPTSNDCNYRDHRYNIGVAEGVVDLQSGKQFPLEANCDILNGVSFNKGCYIGQELTARVHHTGVIRKRHMPLRLNSALSDDSTKVIRKEDGTKVGTVLGNTEKKAIALLRVEQVLKCTELFIDNVKCHAKIPHWWPQEVLSNVSRREVI